MSVLNAVDQQKMWDGLRRLRAAASNMKEGGPVSERDIENKTARRISDQLRTVSHTAPMSSIGPAIEGMAAVLADHIKQLRARIEHTQRMIFQERVNRGTLEIENRKLRARMQGLSDRIRYLEMRDDEVRKRGR